MQFLRDWIAGLGLLGFNYCVDRKDFVVVRFVGMLLGCACLLEGQVV